MAVGEGGKDSFEVVREFITRMGERKPERADVQEIAPALKDIHDRLMKVRAVAPSVDLSERMWLLMEMIGIRAKPVRTNPLRNAASFL